MLVEEIFLELISGCVWQVGIQPARENPTTSEVKSSHPTVQLLHCRMLQTVTLPIMHEQASVMDQTVKDGRGQLLVVKDRIPFIKR